MLLESVPMDKYVLEATPPIAPVGPCALASSTTLIVGPATSPKSVVPVEPRLMDTSVYVCVPAVTVVSITANANAWFSFAALPS